MDTVERAATTGASTFDGFISYSHAADGLLAPRLQSALQRFAKPWWKRRATRLFRDESSLSANPHLWSSITDALDQSTWFVLLLSPDAAASPWVNQEIDYWRTHRDTSRILPVVTDGHFTWDSTDITGNAVPDALRGAFADEPRWVDLRFAREETQLDLKNPRFSAAVADIASALRGVPKDELESEEVKQHRRTIRTAWTAGVVVAVLAVAATGFAIQSAANAREAQTQRFVAETEAERASAEANRADASATEAQLSARLAESRELAASAIAVLDQDPRLSTVLALAAIDQTPPGTAQPVETINALWRALFANPLEKTIEFEGGGNTFVTISPDGNAFAVTDAEAATIHLIDISTLEPVWAYSEQTEDGLGRPTFSADGSRLAVDFVDSEAGFPWRSDRPPDELPNRIVILETETGKNLHTLEFPDCRSVGVPAWSPDGRRLAVGMGYDGCERAEVADTKWVEIFDTRSWDSIALLAAGNVRGGRTPRFIADDRLGVNSTDLQIYDTATFELLDTLEAVEEPAIHQVSGEGDSVAVWSGSTLRTTIHDLETGSRIDALGGQDDWPVDPYGFAFSADGNQLAAATNSFILVWDLVTGEQTNRLAGGAGASSVSFSPDGQRLYSSHVDGAVRVWDLRVGGAALDQLHTFPAGSFVNGNRFAIGEAAAFVERLEGLNGYLEWFSPATGELIAEPLLFREQSPPTPLDDDRFLVYPQATSSWQILDPLTGESQPVDAECDLCKGLVSETSDEIAIVQRGRPDRTFDGDDRMVWEFFDDSAQPTTTYVHEGPGTEAWAFSDRWLLFADRSVRAVFTNRSGDELLSIDGDLGAPEVSSSGNLVALRGRGGPITIVSTDSWTTQVLDLGFERVRGLAFGPSETRLAVADVSEIYIVDLSRGAIVREIPIPAVSDFHWMDDSTLLVGDRAGTIWATVSLDTENLIDRARASVADRPLTRQECASYRIYPCPGKSRVHLMR